MDKKSRLLTIGQFAAMHGINKKILMWYDEIGLFKPAAVNPENGYRSCCSGNGTFPFRRYRISCKTALPAA